MAAPKNVRITTCIAMVGLVAAFVLNSYSTYAKSTLEMMEGRWTKDDSCNVEPNNHFVVFQNKVQWGDLVWNIIDVQGNKIRAEAPFWNMELEVAESRLLVTRFLDDGRVFRIILIRCPD